MQRADHSTDRRGIECRVDVHTQVDPLVDAHLGIQQVQQDRPVPGCQQHGRCWHPSIPGSRNELDVLAHFDLDLRGDQLLDGPAADTGGEPEHEAQLAPAARPSVVNDVAEAEGVLTASLAEDDRSGLGVGQLRRRHVLIMAHPPRDGPALGGCEMQRVGIRCGRWSLASTGLLWFRFRPDQVRGGHGGGRTVGPVDGIGCAGLEGRRRYRECWPSVLPGHGLFEVCGDLYE